MPSPGLSTYLHWVSLTLALKTSLTRLPGDDKEKDFVKKRKWMRVSGKKDEVFDVKEREENRKKVLEMVKVMVH